MYAGEVCTFIFVLVLKLWYYFFLSISITLVVIALYESPSFFLFFIYSELYWIFNFFANLVTATYVNDVRLFASCFFIIFVACLEIIAVSFYLSIKNK